MNLDWAFSTALDGKRYLRLFEKYGHTYRLPKLTNPMPALVTCHPENVHAVLAGQDWGIEFRKAGMGQMLGSGFICTDGPEWKRSRKMLRPAFNRPNIDNFDVLEGVADNIISKIEAADGMVEMSSMMYDAVSDTRFIRGRHGVANLDTAHALIYAVHPGNRFNRDERWEAC
jgi:cytochrome P450